MKTLRSVSRNLVEIWRFPGVQQGQDQTVLSERIVSGSFLALLLLVLLLRAGFWMSKVFDFFRLILGGAKID